MRRRSVSVALCVLGLLPTAGRADDPNAPILARDYTKPIRVACVGDSITYGFRPPNPNTYPRQLGKMLGHDWKVRNFGVSGRTLLKHGDYPYWKEQAYKEARAFKPNVVIIMLGTNDTKPQNWKHRADFFANYEELVKKFQALPSKPRIFVCLPTPVPDGGNYGINEAGVTEEIPLIKKVARQTGAGVINMHEPFEHKAELLPDHVHPNPAGYTVMAATAYHALTGKTYQRKRGQER